MEEAFRAIDKKKPERPRRRLSYRHKTLYGKRAAIKYSKNFKTKDVFNLDEILCVEPIQMRAERISLDEFVNKKMRGKEEGE